MDIQVVFQDEYLIAVNKPVGLAVHKNDFMSNDAFYLTKLVGDMTGKWIYNVHRLDAKTSGIIVLAFSTDIAHELTLQFERKQVEKEYYAIVLGEVEKEGRYDQKVLVKKKSKFKKDALTNYRLEKLIKSGVSHKGDDNISFSLVKVIPETGRWHQIRQHFAKNRHDIVGDSHHGDFALNKYIRSEWGHERLMLHASRLVINHPVTNERLELVAKIPDEFDELIENVSLK